MTCCNVTRASYSYPGRWPSQTSLCPGLKSVVGEVHLCPLTTEPNSLEKAVGIPDSYGLARHASVTRHILFAACIINHRYCVARHTFLFACWFCSQAQIYPILQSDSQTLSRLVVVLYGDPRITIFQATIMEEHCPTVMVSMVKSRSPCASVNFRKRSNVVLWILSQKIILSQPNTSCTYTQKFAFISFTRGSTGFSRQSYLACEGEAIWSKSKVASCSCVRCSFKIECQILSEHHHTSSQTSRN